MTQYKAILEIDADVSGTGTRNEGVFHMWGEADIVETIRTGYILAGFGSQGYGIFTSLADLLTGGGTPKRKGVHLDLGGGQHAFEITFQGWEGAKDTAGNNLQWGSSATEDAVTENGVVVSATGQDPITQMQCFMNYLRVGQTDSRRPARFTWGEYSSGGLIPNSNADNHLEVAIESPRLGQAARSPQGSFDGSLTLVETVDITSVWDAFTRPDY